MAGLHHGLTNAILLPHVMRFNMTVARDRLAALAAALGVDTHSLSPDGAAEAAVAAIEKLNTDIGIPKRLSEVGVSAEMIPLMVPKAMEDGCYRCNPRTTTAADMEALYRQAL